MIRMALQIIRNITPGVSVSNDSTVWPDVDVYVDNLHKTIPSPSYHHHCHAASSDPNM